MVRKVIRSGAAEFTYGRTAQPRPKIDPWRSDLDEMLAKNARRPKRERLTLILTAVLTDGRDSRE